MFLLCASFFSLMDYSFALNDDEEYIRTLDKTEVYDDYKNWHKIGHLSRNSIKTVYGKKVDSKGRIWYRIWFEGRGAYIYHNCTDRSSPMHSIDQPFTQRNVILLDKVTVRKSVWGTKIGSLNKDRIKTIYGMRRDSDGKFWFRIWYNGGPAYILSDYTSYDLRPLKAKSVLVISDAKICDFYNNEIGTINKGKIKYVYGGIQNIFGYLSYKVWYNGNYAYLSEYNTKMRNKPFTKVNVKTTKKTRVLKEIYGNSEGPIGFLEKGKVKTVYDMDKMILFRQNLYKIWYDGKYAYIDADDTKFNVKLDAEVTVRKWDRANLKPIGTIKSGKIKTVYGAFEDHKGGYLYRIWYNGDYAYIKPENTHIYK